MAENRIRYEFSKFSLNEIPGKPAEPEFTFPFTRCRVNQSPVFGADGYTHIGTRYVFDISGVIHNTNTVSVAFNDDAEIVTNDGAGITSFAARIYAMRNVLSRPRGKITIEWLADTGSTWIPLYQFDKDDVYGPKPVSLQIEQFSGGKAAIYHWVGEVTKKECVGGVCTVIPGGTTAPLELSRSYNHSIGPSGLCHRTVSGRLSVTASEALAGRGADQYRWQVVPPKPDNYRREEQSFATSPDGRVLEYSITDQEVMWTLPNPISEGQATYMARLRNMGGLTDYRLAGRFEAPANVSKQTIIDQIATLLEDKTSNVNTANLIWDELTLSEDIYGNTVSFSFAWHVAGTFDSSGRLTAFDNFGTKPPGSDGKSQNIGPYGGDGVAFNSGTVAGTPTIYDACDTTSPPSESGEAEAGESRDDPGDDRQSDTPPPPDYGDLSDAHKAAPYVQYHERYSWDIDNHLVGFPPKTKGAKVYVQQTAYPTVTMIQAGYAVRHGKLEDAPEPADRFFDKSDPRAYQKNTNETSFNTIPLAAEGQFEMKVSWRYIFILTDSPISARSIGMSYPDDPRTTAAAPALTDDTIGEVVEILP